MLYIPGSARYADIKWYPMFPGDPSNVPADYQNAITGTQLLKNGIYVGDSIAAPDLQCRLARTAAGLSRDGRSLILVVVNPGKNGTCKDPADATTLRSLAEYLKSKGANDAITLDGGGSAQMYYNGTWNASPTLSRPSDVVSLPGFDRHKRYYRPVANFLGIR